jgi:hypothetical protein
MFERRNASLTKARRLHFSIQDYGRDALGRYPDPAFFLPIPIEAQIFVQIHQELAVA